MRHPTITLEDFTGMAAGRDVEDGVVESCPRCGRNGVFRHDPAADYVVHVQILEIFGDGMRDQPRDCCTLLTGREQGDGSS
ncbi:MAG TPA: hypothetical protein VFS34_14805 [Thermoanaerobaculia bacterium]|nr:hypothetical protein [Thermoanaerobaculia bacterium]